MHQTGRYFPKRATPPSKDQAIAELADRQHGVVGLDQLRDLGLSAEAVRKRAAAGRLHRLHRGAYAVGVRRVSPRGRWMAAVLACGPGAALSHRSAAALWGFMKPASSYPSVTTQGRAPRARGRIKVHGSRTLEARDVTLRDGIPCTTPARTLLDVAAQVSPQQLERAVEDCERLRLFDRAATDDVLARANGRRGAARLRAAIEHWTEPPFTRSEAERRLRDLVRRCGLSMPAFNTWVAGHEVDAHWADAALVVEVDSFEFHRSRQAFERDRLRDADAAAAGIRVMRITWRQLLRDPGGAAVRLRRALAG